MRLGYNTNGFAHHDLLDCLDILHEIGYRGVALTLDHHALNPYDPRLDEQTAEVADRLRAHGLSSFVETGARYLLDPRRKHQPTMVSRRAEDRERRVDFLCRAVDIAADLRSDGVSIWSGAVEDGATVDETWPRLIKSLERVLDHAARRGVIIGFEPEPGMFISTMSDFEKLVARVDHGALRLTLDVGHLHCQREEPLVDFVTRWRDWVVNVHIEDMRRGAHEHLMFGEGEIDFPPLIAAFRQIGYQGGLHVELSRHSHAAPVAARQAYAFLRPLVEETS